MSTITAAEEPFTGRRKGSLAKTFDEIRVIVWRNLSHIPRVPERLADVTVMPVMFVLLFGYVFGSAISLPGVEVGPEASAAYREFLIAGIFVQSMVFMSITTAVGVANDMREGVIDRFRSLPISRVSLLGGRVIATLVEGWLGITVMAICGLLVGWGAHNGFVETVARLCAAGRHRLRDDLYRHLHRPAGEELDDRADDRLRRCLSPDICLERLRSHRQYAGIPQGLCRMEPGERDGRGHSSFVRQWLCRAG